MNSVSQPQALKSILNLIDPIGIETVSVEDCSGRTLAKDLVSKHFSPQADCSSMDGYGVNCYKGGATNGYCLVGEVSAGKSLRKKILEGEAVRIFTGAIIPKGVNKVIPQEYLVSQNRRTLHFSNCKEKFIRAKGSNFQPGFKLSKNLNLSPHAISLIASMNFKQIPVYKKPKVVILSIGNELSYPGSVLKKSKISSSNAYGVKAFIENKRADVNLLPIIKDDLDSISDSIKRSLDYDLIITIGGASVGKFDLVYDAAINAGIEFSFTEVNMRPGKPFKAGKKASTLFFSLPGNPVSSLICSQIFLGPALEKFRGKSHHHPKREAYLLESLRKNGSRKHFMRSKLIKRAGQLYVKPFTNQDSHNLAVLSKANSLIIRDAFAQSMEKGEKVQILELEI